MIVLDSSFALALVMPDEAQPVSMRTVLEDDLAAPFIWPLEIASALRTNVRRGRLTESAAEALFKRIANLKVDVIAPSHNVPQRHFEAAREHDLTPYDASYLTTAQQFTAALATRDQALAAAATRLGIAVHS